MTPQQQLDDVTRTVNVATRWSCPTTQQSPTMHQESWGWKMTFYLNDRGPRNLLRVFGPRPQDGAQSLPCHAPPHSLHLDEADHVAQVGAGRVQNHLCARFALRIEDLWRHKERARHYAMQQWCWLLAFRKAVSPHVKRNTKLFELFFRLHQLNSYYNDIYFCKRKRNAFHTTVLAELNAFFASA